MLDKHQLDFTKTIREFVTREIVMLHKNAQFVIKTSKQCNLRCQYCSEFKDLHKTDVMTIVQIESMYRHIESYYRSLPHFTDIKFIWHGGEPLLLPPRFYWEVLDLQSQIFTGDNYKVTNSVQTNLTVLDDERLLLLAEGFDGVGVSIDVLGGLRTYENGRDSQARVLANIDRLRESNIPFGCITVLSHKNIDNVEKIYQFYRELNLHARLLPLHDTETVGQNNGIEIDPHSLLKAFKTIFELWLGDELDTAITPVFEMVRDVLNFYDPQATCYFYDKREWENINIVNITGDIYSYADAYQIERSYGNIFTTPLAELYDSAGHEASILAAERRLEQTCVDCKFFGACSGYPIAEDGYEYHELDENGAIRCIVHKGMLQYIEYRLMEEGIIEGGSIDISKLKNIDIEREIAHV
jgi:uncharacterized protein